MAFIAALAAAVALYYFFGREDPVPPWIEIPPNWKLQASRHGPRTDAGTGPQYFLRLKTDTPPDLAMAHVMGAVSDYRWLGASPRPIGVADLRERAAWPQWIGEIRHPSDSTQGLTIRASATSSDTLHVYAWPADGGTIVEVVQYAGPAYAPIEP